MINLVLMRHSRSTANEDGIYDSGRHDAPLSEQGEYLALINASLMEECPDAIYVSDMKRALGTAEIYALILEENFGKKVPVLVVKGLRGQDDGSLEGLHCGSDEYKALVTLPEQLLGGETGADALRRQAIALLNVIESAESRAFGNVLVITHSDVIIRFLDVMDEAEFDPKSLKNCQRIGPFSSDEFLKKILAPPEAAPLQPEKKPPPKPPTPGT